MTRFVALLRAVNVGGTGKMPMSALTGICERLGYTNVRTYIASGNVVFDTAVSELEVVTDLETALAAYAGKPVGVLVRTGAQMAQVLANSPFPGLAGNRTLAIFLASSPPADALDAMTGRQDEQVALGYREIYVHYGEGMASSKLKIPAAKTGTARNMNTVAKLSQMADTALP